MAVRRFAALREMGARRSSKRTFLAIASLGAILVASFAANGGDARAAGEGASAGAPACRLGVATGSEQSRLWAQFDLVSPVRSDGRIRVVGWVIDRASPLRSMSLLTRVVSGAVAPAGGPAQPWIKADQARPDVAGVFPWAGEAHGFDGFVAMADSSPLTLDVLASLDGGTASTVIGR